MVQILLAVGFLLLTIGALLNITRDPLMWGTGVVTALFMILLFRIDPLKSKWMIERGYSFLFKLCKKMKSEYEISIFLDFAGKGFW